MIRRLPSFAATTVTIAITLATYGSSAIATTADSRIRKVETGLVATAAVDLATTVEISEQMKQYGVPGLSIAVIDRGEIAWAKGYGVADTRSSQPVTASTVFQAASISKPVTALAALALVEKGKLSLDRDINEYLKSWKVPESNFTRSKKVTLRSLLSHTAGVAEMVYKPSASGQTSPTLLQILNGAPPAHNAPIVIDNIPGDRYAYSKAGYDILQQLLIDVVDQPFPALTKSTVFQPLGMTRSTFERPDNSSPSIATPHRAGGRPINDATQITEMAAAGLWSTPSDLARFLLEIQRANHGESDRLISPALANQMLTPQKAFHALGPVISGKGAAARFGHDGFNAGFEASVVGYVDRGQGAIVMANSSLAFPLLIEVLQSIARTYEWPNYDSTNMWPPEAPLGQTQVAAISFELASASVGRFESDQGLAITLTKRGAHLFLELPVEGEAEVFAASAGRLFCPQLLFSDFGSPWLKPVFDSQGSVTGISAGYRSFAQLKRIKQP